MLQTCLLGIKNCLQKPSDLGHTRQRFERDYVLFAALFAVIMVLTNVIGTKLFALLPSLLPNGFGWLTGNGPVILTTGIITYPLTFLFTDIVSEVYGKARANFMVLLGFIASILMLLILQLGVGLTPADRYWKDASENNHPGAKILAVDDEGKRIVVSNIDAFDEGKNRQLAVLVNQSEMAFLTYETASINAAGEAEGGFKEAWISFASVQNDLQVGMEILPVVQIKTVEKDEVSGGLILGFDKPAFVPHNGSISLADSGPIAFERRGGNGLVLIRKNEEGELPKGLEIGAALAVQHQFTTYEMQGAYEAAFASPGILLFASMLAYLVAQMLDVYLFHFWRRITKGRHLWLRNNGSTLISQIVDTIIVNGIFLTVAFKMEWPAVWKIIAGVYVCKAVLAAIDTPLIYLGVWLAKRRLGFAMHEEVSDLLQNRSDES
jgi:uncharacterized PurR-regulated membrane protein YhhQ (DUF165 family)